MKSCHDDSKKEFWIRALSEDAEFFLGGGRKVGLII